MVPEVQAFEVEGDPAVRRRFRREVSRQIYLPLGIGVALIAATAVGIGWGGAGSWRGWGDVALVLMIAVAMLPALLVAIGLAGLALGAGWLIQRLPAPARRVRQAAWDASTGVRRGADLAVRPIMAIRSIGAGLRVIGPAIRSSLRWR